MRDISKQVSEYGSLAKIPAASRRQHPQRHVPRLRGDPLAAEGQGSDLTKEDIATLNNVQGLARRRDQVHPVLGQDRGRHRARPRHHGRLEAHRRDGRREDRQDPPDLRPGRRGRTGRRWARSSRPTLGLPVSTTHVLSSGVAGTMAANGSGLQMATLRNIALAWVLTLPAAMMLSGSLYFVFSRCSEPRTRASAVAVGCTRPPFAFVAARFVRHLECQ